MGVEWSLLVAFIGIPYITNDELDQESVTFYSGIPTLSFHWRLSQTCLMFAGIRDSSDDLPVIEQTLALFIDQAFHRYLPNPFRVVLAYSAIDSSIPVITRYCIHDQSFGRSPGV